MNRQVDLVYLELYGVGTYHRLPAAEERAFAKAHQGQAGALRAVVGYADGATAEAYEGELEGRVAAWVTEVALALGNAPRLLRRWLTGSLLATAASALPLAASSSRQ